MDRLDYLKEYGGKGGCWFYHRDKGKFERHLLPMKYIQRGADASAAIEEYPQDFPDRIVRGTHPNDYEGLVDILMTVKSVRSRGALRRAIADIGDAAMDEHVFSYNDYEGQEYDGKVGIMIQLQNPGYQRGSMVEHPHERETFLIDFVDESYEGGSVIYRAVVKGNDIKLYGRGIHDETIHNVVRLYRKVMEGGFIPEEESFQMEFGLNYRLENKDEVLLYQARPFKRFENASFKISPSGSSNYDCFGITSPEGVKLRAVKTRTSLGHGVNEINEPFAMMVDNPGRMPAFVQPRNMVAFLPNGPRANSLEHNNYRWLRKAEVSIMTMFPEAGDGDEIVIFCDGLNYEIEKAA